MTMHGPSCDVCNEYILLDTSINPFSIFGVDGLHCHDRCKDLILAMNTKTPLFWRELPDGRVRQLAEEIHSHGGAE